MFRFLLLFIAGITLGDSSMAQCLCARSPYADNLMPVTQFRLEDGHRLEVCGYKNIDPDRYEAVYSAFVLSTCNGDSILAHWDASDDCTAEVINNALYVKTLEPMAVGPDYAMVRTAWRVQLFGYENNVFRTDTRFDRGAMQYTPEQISETLHDYDKAKWKKPGTYTKDYSEKMMRLANRQLVAAISGSTIAADNFRSFKKRYMLDGPYVEWYANMQAILDFAEENK